MTTGSIRDRAKAAAEDNPFPPDDQAPAVDLGKPAAATEPEPLPDIDYGDKLPDWADQTVHSAWNRVMDDVRSVAKRDEFKEDARDARQAPKVKYKYRGIDRVLNAVGPALRRHGVAIWPTAVSITYDKITSSRGNAMRQCSVVVTYTVYGPKGDSILVASPGESFDTSDKATTKANTVAFRNLLIVALALPTEDPRLDPEATYIERGESALPSADQYLAELTSDPAPSLQRLLTIRREFGQHPEVASREFIWEGAEMTLQEILTTVGRREQAKANAAKESGGRA